MLRPAHTLSGRLKYTNSNVHRADTAAGATAGPTMDLGALQRDDLAGRHLVDVDAAEGVQRARLRGNGVATVWQATDAHRAEAPRVADGDDAIVGQHDERERALPCGQRALEALLPRTSTRGSEHEREHFGVAGGGEAEALAEQLFAQFGCVHEVAVVRHRQRPVHGLDEERLHVAHGVGTGGAVPGVADGVIAREWRHGLGCEHVGHQAGVLVQPGAAAVADRDAGSLLAAVLEREQAEEGQLGDALAVRRRHAEHAALVVG